MTPRALALLAITVSSACCGSRSSDDAEVAALRLTCEPAGHGVRCHALAFFQDPSRTPRDVTAEASWHLSGAQGVRISADGVVDAEASGDVEIVAAYESQQARAHARLTPDRPGQILATLHGHVYVDVNGALRPVGHVQVQVTAGPDAGLSITTTDDGSYEFLTLLPADIEIQATKVGYIAAHESTAIHLGDNHLSLVIEVAPQTGASAALAPPCTPPPNNPNNPPDIDRDVALSGCQVGDLVVAHATPRLSG